MISVVRRLVVLVILTLAATAVARSAARGEGAGRVVGDVNCDAVVNSIDARDILKNHAGLLKELPCYGNSFVDGDVEITSIDAVLVLKFHAGLINHLPPIKTYEGTIVLFEGVEDDCLALDSNGLIYGLSETSNAQLGDRVRVIGYITNKAFMICEVPRLLLNSYIEVIP
jgi:hypothetical protein